MTITVKTSPEFLTPKEVAHRLGVSPALVYRAVARGEIEAVRLTKRGAIRIPASAIKPEHRP